MTYYDRQIRIETAVVCIAAVLLVLAGVIAWRR